MAEPFVAEIRIFSFGFPPKGWAFCNGNLMPIQANQALFSLLGTTYGGDGRQTFGLPNLQGMTPIHMGQGHTLGERGGEQAHTLTISETPAHSHTWGATNTAVNTPDPTGNLLGQLAAYNTSGSNLVAMAASTLSNVGGSQPHPNMQPYLTLNLCIALQGIFPSQN